MSEKYKTYDLYRNAVYFDDEPQYLESFETKDEAKEELRKKAVSADLLFSDYEIREHTTVINDE